MIVRIEVDRNRFFGVKQNLVILPQRYVFVMFDERRNGHDPARDRGDFGVIGQGDSSLGLTLRVIFSDDNAGPDRFDVFKCLLT